MKVSELEGKELAYWVAKATGILGEFQSCSFGKWNGQPCVFLTNELDRLRSKSYPYYPQHDWSQCGELIDKYKASVWFATDKKWHAVIVTSICLDSGRPDDWVASRGKTPQEAICRAVIANVYGEEVNENR